MHKDLGNANNKQITAAQLQLQLVLLDQLHSVDLHPLKVSNYMNTLFILAGHSIAPHNGLELRTWLHPVCWQLDLFTMLLCEEQTNSSLNDKLLLFLTFL